MGFKIKKREEILVENFKKFQFTDIIAFGKLVGAEEKDDFIEEIEEIVEKFSGLDKKRQKALLRLSQQVGDFNLKEKNTLQDDLRVFEEKK